MVKVVVMIVLTLVLFFLIPVNSSLALSSVPPPTAQPPPVVNTPPSILAPGRTTVLPNTPWGLCQSLPRSCVTGGGANTASQLNFGNEDCQAGFSLIGNQCLPVASTGRTITSPSLSASLPSSNSCLPGEISQDNLCIRAQTSLSNSQRQQQLKPQQQPQSVCPQGTTLENNLCYPQQQVPTANFTSSIQQRAPQNDSHSSYPTAESSIQSAQQSGNGTIVGRNIVNCHMVNQTGNKC
jgi:hypothetical protein